jgi:hypothetical protein
MAAVQKFDILSNKFNVAYSESILVKFIHRNELLNCFYNAINL